MICHVLHSMDIAAAVDIERLREIMTELVERSAAVVQRYGGGTVESTDAVRALGRGISAASSSRLVVPVLAIAR